MDDPERLREFLAPEAGAWTAAQLEELKRDIDAMAALLLAIYRSRNADPDPENCGLPRFDIPKSDR